MVFLINIQPESEEWNKIVNNSTFLKKNKTGILWMDKVVNPINKKKYCKTKAEMQNTQETQNLYHGSTERGFNGILENGFKSQYNTVSAFGKGSYFAKNCEYSYDDRYSRTNKKNERFIIVVDICYENMELGSSCKFLENPNNCFVNCTVFPTIYVVENDDAILLKYIICLKEPEDI
jgi:hypothetical protein